MITGASEITFVVLKAEEESHSQHCASLLLARIVLLQYAVLNLSISP